MSLKLLRYRKLIQNYNFGILLNSNLRYCTQRKKMFTNVNKIFPHDVNSVLETYVHNMTTMFSNSLRKNHTSAVSNLNWIAVKLNRILVSIWVHKKVDLYYSGFESIPYFQNIKKGKYVRHLVYWQVFTDIHFPYSPLCTHHLMMESSKFLLC